MSIDITIERLVRLDQVPRLPFLPPGRNGKKLHSATVYRWAQRGVRGVILETLSIGGTRCTSIEALQRFFDALTPERSTSAPQATEQPPAPTPSSRAQVAAARAGRGLDALIAH